MISNVILNDDFINLEDFLKNNYEELWKSIVSEDYNIDFQEFDEFYEITGEDKVIGFIVVEKSDLLNVKNIVDSYILPDFRGNGFLCEYLIEIFEGTHYKILSKKPTRSFIQALLKAGLAYKFGESHVISRVHFDVNIADAYKNSKIKKLYKKALPESEKIHYFANLFDLNLNCLLFNDYMHNYSKNSDTLIIAEPRKYDLKKYNCRKKLKNVSVGYLEETYTDYIDNLEEALESFEEFDEKLEEAYTVENILGSEDKLNDTFIDLLNEANLTVEDGFRIRESILNSINDCEIGDVKIKDRLTFLISNPDFIAKEIDGNDSDKCSFCGKDITDVDVDYCGRCGHELDIVFENFNMIEEEEEEEDFRDFLLNNKNLFEGGDISFRDNDFLAQFNDFNQKLKDFFGDDQDEFFESLRKGDFKKADELFDSRKDSFNPDWQFKEDNEFDNELLRIIDENNYDVDDVRDAQSRIEVYECVKHINENITSWKMPSFFELNHFIFDAMEYSENHGYIEQITSNEFEMYFGAYSTEELKEELKYFDITPEVSRENILKQFKNQCDFSYIITEKGRDYLKSYPVLDFFATHLSEFLFYEFEKYYLENKDKYSLAEIGNNYVNSEFKKAIKSGNLDIYLRYVDYFYSINFEGKNYDEALYYLAQRLIYEINKWYLNEIHQSFEFAISLKTAEYFNKFYLLDADLDLKEIFNRAFNEFKFGHMKNKKDECFEYYERLLNGTHVININDELLSEYFDDED